MTLVLIRTSTQPKCREVSATNSGLCAGLDMSGCEMGDPDAVLAREIRPQLFSPESPEPFAINAQPSAASAVAMPIPLVDPVTIAVLPLNIILLLISPAGGDA
jgi:hypothetical protein